MTAILGRRRRPNGHEQDRGLDRRAKMAHVLVAKEKPSVVKIAEETAAGKNVSRGFVVDKQSTIWPGYGSIDASTDCAGSRSRSNVAATGELACRYWRVVDVGRVRRRTPGTRHSAMHRDTSESRPRSPIAAMYARRRAQARLRRWRVALFGVKMASSIAAAVVAAVAGETAVGNGWQALVRPIIKSALLGGFLGASIVGGVAVLIVQLMVKHQLKQMAKEQLWGETPPSEGHFGFTAKSVGDAFQLAVAAGALLGAMAHSSSGVARIVATVTFTALAVFVFWSLARIAQQIERRALRFGDGSVTRPE